MAATFSPMYATVRQIVTAAGQLDAFEHADEFHLCIEHAPYMRLVIEAHAVTEAYGYQYTRWVSVAHYTEDGTPDTDLEMLAGSPMAQVDGLPIALTYAYSTGYTHIYSRRESDGAVLVSPSRKREVASFARLWSTNLRHQGFVQAAKVARVEGAR